MKKLFIYLFLFLSVFLVSCTNDLTEDTFLLEVKDLSGEVVFTKDVTYQNDLSIFDNILEEVSVDYTEYSFGVMVNGMEGFYPKEYGVTSNYYFGLYVNDVSSMVGISDVTYEKDIKISFVETTMLSELDLEVDAYIELFLNELSQDYVNSDSFNQYVLASLLHLNNYGYYGIDLDSYEYTEFELNTVGNYFKQSLINLATNKTFSETELTNILALDSNSEYELMTLFNLYDTIYGNEHLELRQDKVDKFIDIVPYLDGDFAAMSILALSSFNEDEDVLSYASGMLNYLNENRDNDGVFGYDDKANSSSTAQTVLALLAAGIDPTLEGGNLIGILTKYINDDGFKLKLDDNSNDYAFSTPQAFSAFVMYKIYRDQFNINRVNIWSFN